MAVDLISETPRRYKADEVVMAMVRTFQRMFQDSANDKEMLPDFWMDPEKIPDKLLPLKFADVGWILGDLSLTDDEKRKLIGLIPIIYRQKGTLQGIVSLINLLLGFTATADTQSFQPEEVWIVGQSFVGINTFIGIENPTSFLVIEIEEELTEQDQINVLAVVDFMRVAGTLVILNFPNKVIPTQELFFIGIDEVGGTLQSTGEIIGKKIGNEFNRYYGRNRPRAGEIRDSFTI